ncbi:flagellar basal body-associated protein FliL [Metabacillus iocasae]|uniref:Flagellar protein FliL n=1 Tax=Priestia iocasae TaxID=2291674 RepID=A0ABS2QRD7_9BACI|nr:flagellar basal body-associated protein FliL [Metabacillus iocasae]MBM7701873.1 flagellar FliL protein [Metabacillus iocasae]
MFKNKLVNMMFIILLVLTLVGAVAVVVIMKSKDEPVQTEPSIDEVLESSVDINDVTTNLVSNHFVRISFKIQTNNKKAAEELQKREFQAKDIIIKELSDMKAEDFEGKEGLKKLETNLKAQLNQLMQEGKVIKIYTTSKVLQ